MRAFHLGPGLVACLAALVATSALEACGSDAVDEASAANTNDAGTGAASDAGAATGEPGDGAPAEANADAGADADAGDGDAGFDAGSDPATYNELTDLANWKAYDLVGSGHFAQNGLFGGAFDGRFAYFACANGGSTMRYDTQGAFDAAGSWTPHATAPDLEGGLYDGHHMYFVPSLYPSALRYDPTIDWTTGNGFRTFTTTAVNANAKSFSGAATDGRYVYYLPDNATGTMARFDTQGTFTDTAAWTSLALTGIDTRLKNLHGGVFDGRYLYSADYNSAVVARYDTQGAFTDAASWKTFATRSANADIAGLYSGSFDGRYVYFVPDSYNSAKSVLVRYDTTADFGSAASWSSFDIPTASPDQFHHYVSAFDGRYVYVVPSQGQRLTRYDTRRPFADETSWSSLDLTTVAGGSVGMGTAIFDGRYLYLAPVSSGTHVNILRFDAKTPAALPALPQHHGSFY